MEAGLTGVTSIYVGSGGGGRETEGRGRARQLTLAVVLQKTGDKPWFWSTALSEKQVCGGGGRASWREKTC